MCSSSRSSWADWRSTRCRQVVRNIFALEAVNGRVASHRVRIAVRVFSDEWVSNSNRSVALEARADRWLDAERRRDRAPTTDMIGAIRVIIPRIAGSFRSGKGAAAGGGSEARAEKDGARRRGIMMRGDNFVMSLACERATGYERWFLVGLPEDPWAAPSIRSDMISVASRRSIPKRGSRAQRGEEL
jgi:hypothetical protein